MDTAEPLDVYRDWLGIAITARPLNYYQLLRLNQYEDDQGRIRRHYRKMNSHARKYSTGDYAEQSQQLLNELARAMLCLTDLGRKAEYNESLGRFSATVNQRSDLQNILLASGAISRVQLESAQEYAKAVGLSLKDAISQKGFVATDVIMQAYAQSMGLPFLDLSDLTIDDSLLPHISAVMARTHSVVPVMIENGQLLLASPNPLNLQIEEDLKFRLEMSIRMVLCTPADINRIIKEHYSREVAEAELASRSDVFEEQKEPTGFAKIWEKIKKWIAEHNKK
jgi:hypothetical protein